MNIQSNGAWANSTPIGHCNDKQLCSALIQLFEDLDIKSIVDLGCGPGFYVSRFKDSGYICDGYDGNPYTEELSGGIANVADLSKQFLLAREYDCVLSLEVGEHIPKDYEQIFIDNVCRPGSKYIILSWAVPGQKGSGHVNCQSNEYITSEFSRREYERCTQIETTLRQASSASWFKHTIMVFKKK